MDRFSELTAFRAVAASGGFSAAARQLGLATSSVTRLIDSLERRLGAVLLNRSTRSVTLTESGRRYYEQAQQILTQLESADDEAGAVAADGELRGVLRIAAPVTFCTRHIAPLLPQMALRYPRLELDIHLSDAVSNMVDESIDLAIRIGSIEQNSNLIVRRLAPHERVICASPGYLAMHGTPSMPADLANHNCLQFAYDAARAPWRLQPREGGAIAEVQVRGTLSVNNADVLKQAAIGGMGLAMLASWLVDDALASGALVPVLAGYRVNPGSMDIGLLAIYQANRRGSSKIQAFIELLESALDPQNH
jgi:DNA-binding transcriptional LysR family regulator